MQHAEPCFFTPVKQSSATQARKHFQATLPAKQLVNHTSPNVTSDLMDTLSIADSGATPSRVLTYRKTKSTVHS